MSLRTGPQDGRNKSIDEDQNYFEIQLIKEISDESELDYQLRIETNLDILEPIRLESSNSTLIVDAFEQAFEMPLSVEDFEALTEGPIEIRNASGSKAIVLSTLVSAGSLSAAPYPHLAQRNLYNCENPQIQWESLNANYELEIRLSRELQSFESLQKDLGYFSIPDTAYAELLSEEELQEDLFFDLISQSISRSALPQEYTWLGSDENQEVEIRIKSIEEMNRFLYYSVDCL